MNKRPTLIGVVIATAVIATIFIWGSRSNIVVANLNSSGTSIVAFGDSLVYGSGSTQGQDFVTGLSNRIGLPIVNLGVIGDTTAMGLARIDRVTDQNPRIVILLLGGNDYLRHLPIDDTFANLGEIIDNIQAHGSAVLLLGVRGGLLSDPYSARFYNLAKTHHTAYVPNVLDGLIGHSELMYDEVHPNDAGYAKIVDKVLPVLRMMLAQ